MSGTCIHEPRAPSPSLSGFSTPISEPLYRRLDGDTPACTPETDLTPTQCVLRNVLSIDTGGQVAPGGSSPTPSDGPHFDNSVLKLHEHEACQCGGGAEAGHSPEAGAVRSQSENIRLQSGSGGFLEGLFGCLKPVWTMIGKAYSTEHKHNNEGTWKSLTIWQSDNLLLLTLQCIVDSKYKRTCVLVISHSACETIILIHQSKKYTDLFKYKYSNWH